MGKDKVKSKRVLTRDALVAYLESLIGGLRQGTIILDDEEHPLLLRPSDAIETEMEIKRKSDREKVELKLSWIPNRLQPMTVPLSNPEVVFPESELEAKKK
ncbi:MAG: amphi-Trp domain-containing protein [Deltaproteobacteria bacterium]|nr:amphi-Trp domain-containing protein [Deltaproteobacteria bacterium]